MPLHAAAEKSNFTDGFQRSLPCYLDVTEATNDIFKDFIGNELGLASSEDGVIERHSYIRNF